MKKIYVYAVAIALNISAPSFAGFDIRNVALPNPSTTVANFGYAWSTSSAMLSNPDHVSWEVKPPQGWSSSTTAILGRMRTAISSNYGMPSRLATVVINMCKVYARDPYHCVVYSSAVMCAESTCGNIGGTGIFGVQMAAPSSINRAVYDWISKYNVYWYTANEGYHYGFCKYPNPSTGYSAYCNNTGGDYSTKFFYSNVSTLKPFSSYCLSEVSSGSSTYCPNGYKNSNSAYLRVR